MIYEPLKLCICNDPEQDIRSAILYDLADAYAETSIFGRSPTARPTRRALETAAGLVIESCDDTADLSTCRLEYSSVPCRGFHNKYGSGVRVYSKTYSRKEPCLVVVFARRLKTVQWIIFPGGEGFCRDCRRHRNDGWRSLFFEWRAAPWANPWREAQ